ncbi:FAD-dependent oxidoreductase [Georgenia alba]|uniref:FAD-dependent oxidoreductase n=1 Tax=Georgenia alba TaxID=2233858 RepID=A0ABW2QER4_9MICO
MPFTIEIAGGGIAGLAAAAALAREGFEVHVHERRPEVKEEGGAIVLFEHMMRALDRLDASERATRNGDPKHLFSYADTRGRPHVRTTANPAGGRYVYVTRHDVHRALLDSARDAGVHVHAGSVAVDADPAGRLTLADGQVREADLVVAADGVGSALRARLPAVRAKVRWLRHWGVRVTLDRPLTGVRPGSFQERWAGPLRLGFGPLGGGISAVYLSSPARGLTADRTALDLERWVRAFPEQEDILRDVAAQRPTLAPFSAVVCSSWSDGRVAVIGDAAHGMPPHRGQGAAMAALDAVHLAAVAARERDRLGTAAGVAAMLRTWESEVRPVVARTQRQAVLYCLAQQAWPRPLLPLRPAAFRAMSRTRRIDLSLVS